jgi:hypothetical protein
MPAGYAPTPQSKKLGIAPGCGLLLDHAPSGWHLADPPPVRAVAAGDSADVVVTFVRSSDELVERVEALGPRIYPDGALWIAWPRKAAGHHSDVTENAIREAVLPRGLVDVKVAAVDEDWSGLKIVWRRENRRQKNLG